MVQRALLRAEHIPFRRYRTLQPLETKLSSISRYQLPKLPQAAQSRPVRIMLDPFLAPSRAHHFLQAPKGFGGSAQNRIEAADVVENSGVLAVQVEGLRRPG